MARCTGGANQKGEQTSGRIHLHGGEQHCAKHESDNFSLLSTISRGTARNRDLALPLHRPEHDNGENEGRSNPASSTTTIFPELVPQASRSLDSASEAGFTTPSLSPQRSVDIEIVPPQIHRELPAPVFIAPVVRVPAGRVSKPNFKESAVSHFGIDIRIRWRFIYS